MSLVRIPRLWEKRHYYHEWKTLNENRDLDEDDALELFKHEERRWKYTGSIFRCVSLNLSYIYYRDNTISLFLWPTLQLKYHNSLQRPFLI